MNGFDKLEPYPGWQFFADHLGVMHHLPTAETVRRMIAALEETSFQWEAHQDD